MVLLHTGGMLYILYIRYTKPYQYISDLYQHIQERALFTTHSFCHKQSFRSCLPVLFDKSSRNDSDEEIQMHKHLEQRALAHQPTDEF